MTASDERPIYIIDGQNLYLRSYAAYPQMTADGLQMGGLVGFLKTTQRLCRENAPSRVFVVWEGGGSSRRRKLYSEYKIHRRPERLNRFYEDDIPDTDDNRHHQLLSLIGILKHTPVCQVYVPDVEGDDVVAYLSRVSFKGRPKVIVSSDKDMFQLLDDTTTIYSPHRKRFVTAADVFEEFRVTSGNFALAKTLCGDPGDNVPGIKGIGFKSVSKKFPILSGDDVLLQDVIDYASAHRDESVLYRRVVEQVEDVKRNWQLVFLDGGMLSADQAKRVDSAVDTCRPKSNRVAFMRALVSLKVVEFDVASFFYDMNCIQQVSDE